MTRRGWRHALGTMKAQAEVVKEEDPGYDREAVEACLLRLTDDEVSQILAVLEHSTGNDTWDVAALSAHLRRVIQTADENGTSERLTLWADYFSIIDGGKQVAPKEARSWLEAYLVGLEK